jgi:hypothetical protein
MTAVISNATIVTPKTTPRLPLTSPLLTIEPCARRFD